MSLLCPRLAGCKIAQKQYKLFYTCSHRVFGLQPNKSYFKSNFQSSQWRSVATTRSKSLPLDGVTVVSLEQAIAAPFCTRQLADLGARVIKVERPEVGDFARGYDARVNGMASHFVWTNRSKESLALDLKHPRDLKILKEILIKADVMVQNLAPGATERLGLSHEDLQKTNPGIIVCDISGYGSHGPYRDKKAYDLLVQSEAGMLAVTGTEAEPSKTGISIADIAAGMYAYSNILAALLERGKTGKGRRIDISMLESMAEWMSFPMYYAFNGQQGPSRAGASHATIYPYGPFETGANGASVMMGVQNEREWAILCRDILGDASLATDERFANNTLRSRNRAELKKIITACFSKLSADEAIDKLDKAGIANASMNDMQGVWKHPQLRARKRWIEVETPSGVVPALLPPGVDDISQVNIAEVPSVGQHNEAIFAELGVSEK